METKQQLMVNHERILISEMGDGWILYDLEKMSIKILQKLCRKLSV